jgi:alanyl-tRNA synthetase
VHVLGYKEVALYGRFAVANRAFLRWTKSYNYFNPKYLVVSMTLDKKDLRTKFAKDWENYYKLDFLVENNFVRRVCKKCGKGFWTLDESRDTCPDQPCQYYEFLGNPPTFKKFSYTEAWKHIERFFKKHGHTSIRRYPVVCRWFPTLFFNNASIVDFYRTENGNVVFDFPTNPLVVPQFCLRFNDIPNIGATGRHYSCFVMVGQLV